MLLRSRPRLFAFVFASLLPVSAHAQSVLQRTPNLPASWQATRGTVYFNFLHRFVASDAPVRQVTNFPTFLLGAGLPGNILAGAHYSTRSDLVAGYPNEWEFFARGTPLDQFRGFPVDLTLQAGYNLAAESFDAELNVARQFNRLRLIGAVRALSSAFAGDSARFVFAGGGTIQLSRWLALAGDYAQPFDKLDDEDAAWGAALQIAIPYTPHTVSLQVTNTNTATLQGASRGSDERRYGFEFTVPITLARYFGKREAAATVTAPTPTEQATDTTRLPVVAITEPVRPTRDTARADTVRVPVTPPRDTTRSAAAVTAPPTRPQQPAANRAPAPVTVRMRQLNFEPRNLRIAPGTQVVWRNDDQVVHTVKAGDGSWESPQIQPGATYRRTFTRAGRFEITCGPHPFMKQIVEVR